jgi:Family of unknown function (DUF6314)
MGGMNPVQACNSIELRSVKQVFSALAGTWDLSRTIGEWKFRGSAVFRLQDENELRYEETGILSKEGNADIPAFRRYVYRYEADRIAIYFDGHPKRIFQLLDLKCARNGHWEGQAEHLCPPDHYASRYSFGRETIEITHLVRGPRKDYDMVTNYRIVSR